MKKVLLNVIKVVLICVVCFFMLVYCSREYEDGESDKKIYPLDRQIASIKDGLPFAIAKAEKWRAGAEFYRFVVTLIGKDEIVNKRGEIVYYFYKEKAKGRFDGSAKVVLDMKTNSITSFDSLYGTSKYLMGNDELDIDNWKLDIDEAVDIAFEKIGKDKILSLDKPIIEIECRGQFWDITVLNEKLKYLNIFIDPTNLNVLSMNQRTENGWEKIK